MFFIFIANFCSFLNTLLRASHTPEKTGDLDGPFTKKRICPPEKNHPNP